MSKKKEKKQETVLIVRKLFQKEERVFSTAAAMCKAMGWNIGSYRNKKSLKKDMWDEYMLMNGYAISERPLERGARNEA